MRGLLERPDGRHVLVASMLTTFGMTRAWLHAYPDTDLTIGPYDIHHLFTGVVIVTACGLPAILAAHPPRMRLALIAGFGAGLALVLDEWLYLIVTDGSNAAYVELPSVTGGVVRGSCLCVRLVVAARSAITGGNLRFGRTAADEGSDLDFTRCLGDSRSAV